MNLNELKLRSFRNYREIAARFDPGVNLIVGDNAQGKTNLLEAISYLGSGKSFRAQKTSEMVRFQEDFGEIDGSVFSQERQQSIRWLLFPGSRPRQLWLNGAKKKTAGEIAGVLPTVLFCPEDLMILKMGASQRRRFGDLALCALRPNYDAALTEYNRILEQKGRILKDHFENPGILEILPEYNTRLCQVGALLISYRARFYDGLGKAAANYHNQFSGGTEEFTLSYKTVSTVVDPFAPIPELTQKEGSLRFALPQPDFAQVAAVCGLPKYKSRLLFSAGEKPYLALRLKKGDDVLKLAGIVLEDLAQAAGGEKSPPA